MLIEKTQIAELLGHLAQRQTVYVPAVERGASAFVSYAEGVEPAFDLQNTRLSPKALFFPSTERLYKWGSSPDGASSIESAFEEASPFVVFGARPCDVAAIERMDQVFLTKGYVDEFYQTKREAATIVALACNAAGKSCFCESFGIDPNAAQGADCIAYMGDDTFELKALTEKGEALLGCLESFGLEGSVQRGETHCSLSVDTQGLAAKLHDMFDSPLWDEVSTPCLTCGTCTFVCPTCHCFDISQERKAEENTRFRCWDSCMFSNYTLMAGNHNPRANKSQRVRQRFMHKLCFFEERYGESLCVGCGRCIANCPAAVNIAAIVNRANELAAKGEE